MVARSQRGREPEARAPARGGLRDSCLLHLLIVAVASLALYAGALDAGFTFDDQRLVVNNAATRTLDLADLGSGWGRRQVRLLSFKVDYALFGLAPRGYHVHSLLWHLLSVSLLYLAVRRLTGRGLFALPVALLFAAHPIHVEAVANVSNRKELLCMAFSLLAALGYCRSLGSAGARRWAWLGASFLAWLLALFSKQVAIVLPLSLAVYELLFLPAERRFLTRSLPLALGGALAGGVGLVLYLVSTLDLGDLDSILTMEGFQEEASGFEIALTSARTFWGHLRLLAWPVDLCPDYVMGLSRSLLEPATLLAWLGLAAWAGLAVACWRRAPLLSFALSWVFIHWLPVSNLMPTAYLLADRYMYIPSAGFCLLLVCVGDALRERVLRARPRLATPLAAGAAVLLLGAWSLQTVSYTARWSDERTLWSYAVQCNPRSARGWNGLGFEELQVGNHHKALAHFNRALEFEPRFPAPYVNRATALLRAGDLDGAVRAIDLVVERWPENADAFYNRGNIRLARGEARLAVADYSRAIELLDSVSAFFHNRASAYMELEEFELAVADLERAIELDPRSAMSHFNLGLCFGHLGDVPRSLASHQTAARLGHEPARQVIEKLRALRDASR